MGKKYSRARSVPADVAGALRDRRGVYLDDDAARFIRQALKEQSKGLPTTKRRAEAVKGGSRSRRQGR